MTSPLFLSGVARRACTQLVTCRCRSPRNAIRSPLTLEEAVRRPAIPIYRTTFTITDFSRLLYDFLIVIPRFRLVNVQMFFQYLYQNRKLDRIHFAPSVRMIFEVLYHTVLWWGLGFNSRR